MASLMTTAVDTEMKSLFNNEKDLQTICSCTRTKSESFFYCNNPETLEPGDLADDGKYLTNNKVTGSGQIYTWHRNKTNKTIHSVILIYNHNNFNITVTATNIGFTNSSGGCDRSAWESYYSGGQPETVSIPASGFKSILVQDNIKDGNVFGKIARFKIVQSNDTKIAASAYFYDLAYYKNSGNAHDFAVGDVPPQNKKNSRRRGVGNGFYNYLTIGTNSPIELTNSQPTRAATIGGVNAQTDNINDSFKGADMAYIEGKAGDYSSGYLYGSYGMQMRITMNVKNNTNQAREIRIFMGCSAVETDFPVFVRYNKAFFRVTSNVKKWSIRDVITLGIVGAGETQQVVFDTVNLAQSAAPYYIGARLV